MVLPPLTFLGLQLESWVSLPAVLCRSFLCISAAFQVAMMVFSVLQIHQTKMALVRTPDQVCFVVRMYLL